MKFKIPHSLFILLSFFHVQVWGYTSTMMNGDILLDQNYDINLETQYIDESKNSGLNVNARFDAPLNEEMNLRGIIGFGETDFHIGGFLKWIPIPDYDRQPAIGVLTGVHYARFNQLDEFSLRAHPYVGKKFDLSVGSIAPYVSLPVAIRFIDSDLELPIQFQLGTELRINQLEHFRFLAEFGLDINKSFTYFSLGLTFHFDRVHGAKFN